jgi:polar amino acid transport system substrate-binding protein
VIRDFLQAVARDLVPSGTLRAAIAVGSAVVAPREAGDARPRGLAVDLVNELARRLSVPNSLVEFDGIMGIVDAGADGDWDIAFLAIDPTYAARFDFTPPYVVFEGTFLVHDESPYRTALDLDHDGIRIAVCQGTTFDLHLTRTLRRAQLVRSPTFKGALDLFRTEGLDAIAGLKQTLDGFARANDRLHVIDGRFAAIGHAIAVPKGRLAGVRYLKAFVEEMKASGRIASWLQRSADLAGGAAAAPPPQ